MSNNVRVSLTEQCIMNESFLHELKGWRCYRIEYVHEGSDPEGVIYLPSFVDPSMVEKIIQTVVDGKYVFTLKDYKSFCSDDYRPGR